MITALSGSDSIIINSRPLSDLADGDCINLTYPNNMSEVKTGKNGNSIYSFNATGRQAEVEIRIIRGSADDRFMNNLLALQENDFASFILVRAEFIKKIGDGLGTVANDTHVLSGGVFMKRVEAKSNSEGDTEQSVSIYSMKFSNGIRAIS